MSGEGPLEVTFTNQSENGDEYEWFFFYDLDYLTENLGGSTNPDDSIMQYAVNESPVFVYENSGTYMVKLVSKKINQNLKLVCVDTTYMEDYITVDTSFIAVPNVFTPNGDGTNDLFVVKFWSMQNVKISIFNRWGQRIHFWQSGDVRGFESTWIETVWDGRLMAGRMASPGVYYYSVDGVGRDGEKRHKNGFFHLFNDKN
jgi:gliding motility-associated-like protein